MSWSLFQYVLIASMRDKVILSLFFLIALGISLSLFVSSSAIIEQDAFALIFAAGGLRMAGAAGLVLFVVSHMRRSFETKDVDFLLSRPIGRLTFLLSHAAAFSFLALVLACAVMTAVVVMVPGDFGEGHFLWTFSVMIEFIIMVNVALFFSMVISSAAASAMITLAFYVLARLIGQILGILAVGVPIPGFQMLSGAMEMISMVIPRLDLMGQTSWLLYGPGSEITFTFLITQGVVFTALILCASLVDLVRRQF